MFKNFKLYLVILLISASSKAFGLAEFNQTFSIYNPSIILINSINPDLAFGVIEPSTGNVSNPKASFSVLANGFLFNHEFILTAKTNTQSGEVNAYYNDGNNTYLILSNASDLPLLKAVNNIKSNPTNPKDNKNAIAYMVSNQNNTFYTTEVRNSAKYDGTYFSLLTYWYYADIEQMLNTTPMQNTYSISDDRSGIYRATLTLTVLPNP